MLIPLLLSILVTIATSESEPESEYVIVRMGPVSTKFVTPSPQYRNAYESFPYIEQQTDKPEVLPVAVEDPNPYYQEVTPVEEEDPQQFHDKETVPGVEKVETVLPLNYKPFYREDAAKSIDTSGDILRNTIIEALLQSLSPKVAIDTLQTMMKGRSDEDSLLSKFITFKTDLMQFGLLLALGALSIYTIVQITYTIINGLFGVKIGIIDAITSLVGSVIQV